MMVKLVVEIWIQPTRRKGANFALRAVVLAHHATQTYLQWLNDEQHLSLQCRLYMFTLEKLHTVFILFSGSIRVL